MVIGRNEGDRLKRCLRSLPNPASVVYVDSGSSDGSVAFASALGVKVIPLDMSQGFTAARARNAGWRAIAAEPSPTGAIPDYVQFVDGDCELDAGWMATAADALDSDPRLAVVFGRRRERFPEASPFNRMCDEEWNVPIGLASACGGDAMMRLGAVRDAGGYCDELIAGEEPDLCLRLRAAGWLVRRIDAEMTLHDADIHSLSAWWRRSRRSGYAYTAHVLRHGDGSDPVWRRQVRSIGFWGFAWPLFALACFLGLGVRGHSVPALLALVALGSSYALQVLRIARRRIAGGSARATAWQYGALVMLGKFAEFGGVVRCLFDRLRHRRGALIEYKGAA